MKVKTMNINDNQNSNIDEVINGVMDEVSIGLDKIILRALENKGVKIDNVFGLHALIKNKCEIIILPCGIHKFYLESEEFLILKENKEPTIEQDKENTNTFKINSYSYKIID